MKSPKQIKFSSGNTLSTCSWIHIWSFYRELDWIYSSSSWEPSSLSSSSDYSKLKFSFVILAVFSTIWFLRLWIYFPKSLSSTQLNTMKYLGRSFPTWSLLISWKMFKILTTSITSASVMRPPFEIMIGEMMQFSPNLPKWIFFPGFKRSTQSLSYRNRSVNLGQL